MSQDIKAFFDDRTWTMSYVVYNQQTRDAVVIDPVLDYTPEDSKVWTESAQEIIAFLEANEISILIVSFSSP